MEALKISLFAVLIAITSAKVYDRCQLARELRYTYQLPQDQIATWVCIAYHESRYDTSLKANGEYHGIFQISNRYWCSPPGTGCNLSCSKLLNDDISDDVKCARTVFDVTQQEQGNGFLAWSTYANCRDNVNQYTANCF